MASQAKKDYLQLIIYLQLLLLTNLMSSGNWKINTRELTLLRGSSLFETSFINVSSSKTT